jgi:tetratricopeptide (TPR) repeat protein
MPDAFRTHSRAFPGVPGRDRLESWKEIASYLKRDVTTVRRWEKREGLPVRRHHHASLDTVYAFRSEIDAWRERRDIASAVDHSSQTRVDQLLPGRSFVLASLGERLRRAIDGQRQVVCVSGEVGIGKTAVVHAFAKTLGPHVWASEGHSAPLHGPGRPYLPVFDAISRLCRQPDGQRVVDLLGRHAPTWLDFLQPPARSNGDHSTPVDRNQRDHLAMEITEALEAIARVKPLVLVLEDLHWSDNSTVELIAQLARRAEPARLLLIATYRPAERTEEQPYFLRVCQELQVHFQLEDLALHLLSVAEVQEYLQSAYGRWRNVDQSAAFLHSRTEGNPLFLVHLVQHLVGNGSLRSDESGWYIEGGSASASIIPPTLRGLIENEIGRLAPTDRRILTVASVIGSRFADQMVAHAAGLNEAGTADALCALARRKRLVRAEGTEEGTDGTLSGRFAFVHQVYRDVLYDLIEPAERAQLHRRVAERYEGTCSGEIGIIAAELALHFERGLQYQRAAEYYAAAADGALRVNADAEAEGCAVRGIEATSKLPDGEGRNRLELKLRLNLCAALSTLRSGEDSNIEAAYQQVAALSSKLPSSPELIPSLLGIARYHQHRGRTSDERRLINLAMEIASSAHPELLGVVRFHDANLAFLIGDHARACEVAEKGSQDEVIDSISSQGFDHRGGLLNVLCWSRCMQGHGQSAKRAAEGQMALARASKHPLSTAFAEAWSAPILELLGEAYRSVALIESAHAIGTEHNFKQVLWWSTGVKGWLLARRGQVAPGLGMLHETIVQQRAAGMLTFLSIELGWLSEALLLANRSDAALIAADEGLELCRSTDQNYYEPELHRLRGDALIVQSLTSDDGVSTRRRAEAAFREGIAVARAQSARFLELRAVVGLGRLLIADGRRDEALLELMPSCSGWDDENQCPDLRAGQALLEDLGPVGFA